MNLEQAKAELAEWDVPYLTVSIKHKGKGGAYCFEVKVATLETLPRIIESSKETRVFELSETHPSIYYTEKFKSAEKLKKEAEEIELMQALMKKYIAPPEEDTKILRLVKTNEQN